MSSDHFSQFIPGVCAGFGLFLAGGANLMLLRRGFVVKALSTLLAFGIVVGSVSALGHSELVLPAVKFFAIGLTPCLLLASRWFTHGAAAFATGLNRPAVRFGLMSLVGLGSIIGSVAVFEVADEKLMNNALVDLELTTGANRSTKPTTDARAATDKGHPVELKEPLELNSEFDFHAAEDKIVSAAQLGEQIIRRGPADERSNCHGWVFTGGKFLISGTSVEVILAENGYQEVHEPQAGDLVIYRQTQQVAHTGLVRYVTEGQPVLVESKWGTLGIFLHPAEKSVYGEDFTFYRSTRKGHLLVGLGGVAPTVEHHPAVVSE